MPEITIKIIKIRSAATQWAAGFRSTARECPRQNSQRESGRQCTQIRRAGSSIPLTQFCLKCWPQAVRERSSERAAKKKERKKHKAFTILPGLNVLQQDSECFCFLLEDTTSESGENQSLTFVSTILFPVMEKKPRNMIIQNPECSLKSLNVVF